MPRGDDRSSGSPRYDKKKSESEQYIPKRLRKRQNDFDESAKKSTGGKGYRKPGSQKK